MRDDAGTKLLALVHPGKDVDEYVRAINTVIRENHPVCTRRTTVVEPTLEDGELSDVWSVSHFGIGFVRTSLKADSPEHHNLRPS